MGQGAKVRCFPSTDDIALNTLHCTIVHASDVSICLSIVYLFSSSPVQTGWSIFTLNGSNDVVWRKEVPFGGKNHKI